MHYHVGTPTNKGKKMAGKKRETVFLDSDTIEILDKEIANVKASGYKVNYSDVINVIVARFNQGVNKK